MRNISILCSGLLALALLAAPAKAESTTQNTVFAVFDLGGFDFDGTGEEYYNYDESSDLLFVNIASLGGSIEDFLGVTFNNFDFDGNLGEIPYFLVGHITGSDHLVLSADGEAAPLPGTFDETSAIDGVLNIGDLDGDLLTAGGSALISPEQFGEHFGNEIGDFTQGGLGFDTVLSVGGDDGDMLGFTDPTFLATFRLDFVDGQIVGTQVPEPGLALLALFGLAGAAIARRRRRAAK